MVYGRRMKGHKDSSGKFHPHISSSRLSSEQILEIKKRVLPLTSHAKMMTKFYQENARRDRFATPRWNAMSEQQKITALEKAGVRETAMGSNLPTRKELAKRSYVKLPHYAKNDLGFHYFKLDREGNPR